jgi:hypothetical protein
MSAGGFAGKQGGIFCPENMKTALPILAAQFFCYFKISP